MNACTARLQTQPPRRLALLASVGLFAVAAMVFTPVAHSEAAARLVPPPVADVQPATAAGMDTAVFAGGCFWGVQGVFQHVAGVSNAVSGYAGGNADAASYERVGSGATGHAEAVKVVYDPKRISYGRLLQIYFSVAHDPTELNRQGPDTGTQYRSTVFPLNADQERVAKAYIAQLNGAKTFGKPLATTVETGKPFYAAEAYHQDFLTLNPRHPYIVVNDLPKIDDLKRLFPGVYQATPVLVGASRSSMR